MYSHHIRCAHQSAPLHQVSPSQCSFTSVVPNRVPLYTRYPHHISPSECPFTSYFLIIVPLSITCAQQSAPFHSMCPFEPP
ncbi:unnamed protein product [Staurois parvus]|uniref:Uncharacterized protein n=1 Tax=Staurois parvus TaxID=386267 RepID=A0ABN9FR60_9NEOB|nr:unnamed protein product [Staurois parvus]